jgi:hypothetical protein
MDPDESLIGVSFELAGLGRRGVGLMLEVLQFRPQLP